MVNVIKKIYQSPKTGKKRNGFSIIEKYGEYQISWEQGPYNQPVFYPISKQNMDKAFKSIKTFMK